MTVSAPTPPQSTESVSDPLATMPSERKRVAIFFGLQIFFLFVSFFAGGFRFEAWSMLDTALMIQCLGITGLIMVVDTARMRSLAFKIAIVLYILSIIDMGVNVLVSGFLGWRM